ncbi:MAG TPA: cysteine methyltransferase, partial [Rhizobiaceae bacterium]
MQTSSVAPARGTSGQMVFETALGFVGIAWSDKGLTRLSLFQRDRAAVERRMARLDVPAGFEGDGEEWVAALVRDVRAYAEGENIDFSDVPVDLGGVDDFRLAIYEAARKLGFGETTTYGELAKRAGHDGLPRETGQ